MNKKQIPKKSDGISEWYNRVILAADLADYGPAKGTMIFKPYGYRIWELVQEAMNPLMRARGVENAYFPLFIPVSLLDKEKSHVKGFSPELAVVTHGGGEKLTEPLAIRPTSETVMYNSFSKWIESWRDLPLLLNQWNNVVRWEKRTYLFMRTSEFLWQEGHTVHASHQEAVEMQKWAMDMYTKIYREHFALFGYAGYKSTSERFAGADSSLSYEVLMPSGKALQSATSHDLGQNFSQAFGIKYQNQNGGEDYAWQTSWGLSTRSLGGLILAHGDDSGLRLPPRLAPVQVIILPVRAEAKLLRYAEQIEQKLKALGTRVQTDANEAESLGYRINKWELKGVPIRIEVGEKEASENTLTLVRRDDTKHTRLSQPLEKVGEVVQLLAAVQESMLKESERFTMANTHVAKTYSQFQNLIKTRQGFVRVAWKDDPDTEAKIQADTAATSRCLITTGKKGKSFYDETPTDQEWLFAKSY